MTACTTFVPGAFTVRIYNQTSEDITCSLQYMSSSGEVKLKPGASSDLIPITAFTAGIAYPHSILQTTIGFENEAGDKTFGLGIEGKKSPEIKVIVLTDEIWSYEYEYGNDFGYYIDGEIVHKK